jgi:hypothetical protein
MCTLHEMLLELHQESCDGQNMLYAYRILVLGPLSLRHVASSGSGWRRRLPDMEGSYKYIE